MTFRNDNNNGDSRMFTKPTKDWRDDLTYGGAKIGSKIYFAAQMAAARPGFTIDFYAIEQYTGRMTFESSTDFAHEVSCMLVDDSIVAFQARYPNGKLYREFVNHKLRDSLKTCPCEKSWVNTLGGVSPEQSEK